MLKPVFTLSFGSYRATEADAVGGPTRIVVERAMASAADALEVILMDRSGVAPGDPATVELGHDDSREKVFTGEVAEVQPTLAGVRIRALGTTNALLNLRVAAMYENQAAGSIVRDLVGQAGLDTGTIDDGPLLPRYAVDRRLSAHRHVRDLADRLGYELYTDRDGKLMFHGLGDAASLDAGGLGALAGAAASLLGAGGEGYEFGKHLTAAAGRQRVAGADQGRDRRREPDVQPGRHDRALAQRGRRRQPRRGGRRRRHEAVARSGGADPGSRRSVRRRAPRHAVAARARGHDHDDRPAVTGARRQHQRQRRGRLAREPVGLRSRVAPSTSGRARLSHRCRPSRCRDPRERDHRHRPRGSSRRSWRARGPACSASSRRSFRTKRKTTRTTTRWT